MKRIFSILIALMLVFTAIPVIETEAFMIPEDQFYIKFSSGSGSGGSQTMGPFSVSSGTALPSAEALGFSKEGYEFTGWSIGKAGSIYKTSGGQTVSASAQWKEISSSSGSSSSGSSSSRPSSGGSTTSKQRYNVTYFSGDGEGLSVTKYYDFDEPFYLIACPSSFTYKDHVFVGWQYGNQTYKPGEGFNAPNKDVDFTAIWKSAGVTDIVPGGSSSSSSSESSSSSSSSSSSQPASSSKPATSSKPASSSKPVSSSSSSSESSEPESSSSSSSVVETPVEDVFEPVSLAFSINGDIPVTKIEFLLKEDIGGEPTISIVPLDGYSVTDKAAAKFIADGDALAAFDISLLSDGMAYKDGAPGTVTYSLNGTQANAESNYDSYVFAMVHTVSTDKHVGEYYMTDGELVYLYNPETDFKTAVDNVKLVEEDGVYRLVIKDPSGLSSFAYEAAEGVIVEVKLVASSSAESASIDVTSLSPVLLAHIEVGEGKSSGAGIPLWVWIVVGALVLVVGILVALFLISRRNGNSSSSEKHSSGSYSGITGFDEE